jgi:hypothetical protein
MRKKTPFLGVYLYAKWFETSLGQRHIFFSEFRQGNNSGYENICSSRMDFQFQGKSPTAHRNWIRKRCFG